MYWKDFVNYYKPHAKAIAAKYNMPALALVMLTQSAVETGWGRTIVGNMMFGIKDTDGINGNEQLLTTTEDLTSPNIKFPVIISIKQTSKNLWHYVVKDYFRKYDSPAASFEDHAKFLMENKNYKTALTFVNDPERMLIEIAKGGYATAPNYAAVNLSVLRSIKTVF